MPLYIHRTTFQRLPSTSPSSLTEPEANYVKDPDESAITGEPSRYWILTLDVFTLMKKPARDAVDDALDVERLDSVSDELDRTQTIMKAFAQVVLDEFNLLRAEHGLVPRTLAQLKNAVRGKL